MVAKKRIQFDFTLAEANLLDDLVQRTGHKTRAEVLRRALREYARLVNLTKAGKVLMVEGPEDTLERITFMP